MTGQAGFSLKRNYPQVSLNFFEKIVVRFFGQLTGGSVQLIKPDGKSLLLGKGGSQAPIEIKVHDKRFYKDILLSGTVGLGESYTQGYWETNNLTAFINLLIDNEHLTDDLERKFAWLLKPVYVYKHWQNRNSIQQAKHNILAHYDLGNELYTRFLDSSMCYSSGYYPTPETTLAESQVNKMEKILAPLELKSTDHLLEIGTGWGGLAVYAALKFGCKVTTTTLSEEQYQFSKERVEAAGLQNLITLLKQDYRLLEGQYDKIVSVEMIEAVGKKFMPTYFTTLEERLKPGGKISLQSITIADQRMESYSSTPDFIQTHIFPGGFLPSVSLLTDTIARQTSMVVRSMDDFGVSYARTLSDWRDNFLANKDELNELGYDDQFFRLWLFYFAYCEAGFLKKKISVIHLCAEKPND